MHLVPKSWKLFSRWRDHHTTSSRVKSRPYLRHLRCESLEDRQLLSVSSDLVIAAMGDSYSSGEGNPTWLDNGSTTINNLTILTDSSVDNSTVHRSSVAAAVLFAEAVALANPDSSITLAFASESGATISGSAAGQITQLKNVLNGQAVDDLLLSFGGNDVGFARIVETLLLADRSIYSSSQYTKILNALGQAVNSGSSEDWATVKQCLKSPKNFLAVDVVLTGMETTFGISAPSGTLSSQWNWLVDQLIGTSSCTGLSGLNDTTVNGVTVEGAYHQLSDLIQDNLSVENIYLTEYPAPFLGTDSSGNTVVVGFSVLPFFGISTEEANWVNTNLYEPLQEAMQLAADTYGWTYVSGIADSFAGHQYGSLSSWFVSLPESYVIEGSINGMLHPNLLGQMAIAEQLYAAIGSTAASQLAETQTVTASATLSVSSSVASDLATTEESDEEESTSDSQLLGTTLETCLDAGFRTISFSTEEQFSAGDSDSLFSWIDPLAHERLPNFDLKFSPFFKS